MTALERWARAGEIAGEVLDFEPAERRAVIASRCGDDASLRREVEAMCALEGRRDDLLARPLARVLPASARRRDRAAPMIDRYRVLRRLGQGGMGTVYLAERADGSFERQVAIKVLHRRFDAEADADGWRRIERERQCLAGLDHPGIARLLDGGTTRDGMPYLVMERVDGLPFDAYCDTERLDLRQRLALFLEVVDAVGYAHRNLIVHRDLKPANILVARAGRVKLLDFGIAKLLGPTDPALTRSDVRLLTPRFASPEQIEGGPITTATDVYSLGVILYRLFAGDAPYRTGSESVHALEHAILEQVPRRPSRCWLESTPERRAAARDRASTPRALARQLRGDLDTIVSKALSKEPKARYRGVEELGDDLRRWLADRPIRARPASWRYRLGKFAQRHRALVAAAALMVVSTIVVAMTLVSTAQRVARERNLAQHQRAQSDHVVDFLLEVLRRPAAVDAAEIDRALAVGLARIDRLDDQPVAQVAYLIAIGRVLRQIGRASEAQTLLERAAAVRAFLPSHDLATAESLNELATLYEQQGDLARAEPIYRQAVEIRRTLQGARHRDTAMARNNLAMMLWRDRQLAEAESELREARAVLDSGGARPDAARLTVLANLALVLQAQRRFDEAEPLFVRVLAGERAMFGSDDPRHATTLNNLAAMQSNRGRFLEAELLARRSLAIRQRRLGPRHATTAVSMHNLALILREQLRFEEAEDLLRQALEIRRAVLPPEDPTIGHTRQALAQVNGWRERIVAARASASTIRFTTRR